MASPTSQDGKIALLRAAFKACDVSNTGRLSFDEFFALLKKGNPRFEEPQAQDLFEKADEDMSGEVDFDEFVEYIFNNKTLDRVFKLEASASEEEAKQCLMNKPGPIRAAASKSVKDAGGDWRAMTWKERLEVAKDLEKEASEDSVARTKGAPTVDATSSSAARRPDRNKPKNLQTVAPSPKSAKREKPVAAVAERRQEAKTVAAAVGGGGMASLLGAKPGGLAGSVNKFAIADMSQTALVDYSLQEEDLDFAGNNADIKSDLAAFKDYLKTADSPLSRLNIIKFIAKGTAGWVFLCEDKTTGARCAMKLIRMTQARSGIKEWYCSKVLTSDAVSNVVFTDETVQVVQRSSATDVIKDQIAKARPVNYFMAMIQELMPWGTLEDLAKEGELSPEIMFECLEDVAKTLAVMHANGLQHRDVKPENIMLQMNDQDEVLAAKLCDFGSAQVGTEAASMQDDIRRFGVTLFSVATGEGWTKNRLIREKHDALVARLTTAVQDSSDPSLQRLPKVLEQILSGSMTMAQVATVMEELDSAYDD